MSRTYHPELESKDYSRNIWTQQDLYSLPSYHSSSTLSDYDRRPVHESGMIYTPRAVFNPPSMMLPLLSHYRQGIIYFGVTTKPNTLLGSCAWWLLEPNGAAIASGAIPVVQKFPSKTYLEYKALFHALNCANVNGIRILTIRTTSCIVIDSIMRQFEGRGITCMSTVYHMMRELCDPLWKAFERLHHYDIQIVETTENTFCQRLADRTFYKFSKRNLSEIK